MAPCSLACSWMEASPHRPQRRRRAARQATAEAYETLDNKDLSLDQRIRLIEMLGKWGGMEIKRIESVTKIDLSSRTREDLEAELARLRG